MSELIVIVLAVLATGAAIAMIWHRVTGDRQRLAGELRGAMAAISEAQITATVEARAREQAQQVTEQTRAELAAERTARIEDAMASHVMVATPTTLVAFLLAIAFGWQQQQAVQNRAKIAASARELFERVGKFTEHLVKVHDGLRRTMQAYNAAAAASFDTRIVPAGRLLIEPRVVAATAEVIELGPVEVPERALAVAGSEVQMRARESSRGREAS